MLCWHKSIACHVIKKTFYVVFDATKNIKMYVQLNSLFAVLNFRKKFQNFFIVFSMFPTFKIMA